MPVSAALQFHDNTFFLSGFLRNHRECFGNLAHLHLIHHFCYLRRQFLHLELGSIIIGIGQQTMIIACILILRKHRCRFLKRELSIANVIGNRIQTRHPCRQGCFRNMRLQQDVAGLDTIAPLLYQLDDMKAILRLHDFGYFVGILQVESDISIGRIQHATSGKFNLTTTNGRSTIFGIHTGQRREAGLTLCDAVGEIAQTLFHILYLFQRNLRLLSDNLNLYLCRNIGDTVLRQVFEVTAHLGRRNLDFTNQLLLHLLHFQTFTSVVAQSFANLTGSFIEVFLHFLA